MKLNKRRLFCVLLLSFLVLFVTACGKKETVTTEEPEDITAGFEAKKDYIETTKDDTKIYRMPEEEAEVYGNLKKGVDLSRTGVKGPWTRIRLNDTTLYVKSANVKETTIEWVTEHKTAENQHIVFIDPAKQINANAEKEGLFPEDDPESENSKAKMGRASVGVSSGLFEYELTLSVAKKLQKDLEQKGYTVVLSRTADTVNISNAERALMGNRSDAEILVRLTASASTNAESKGVFSLIASATNPSTKDMYQDSFYLANMLLTDTCLATGATRLGVYQTDKTVFLNHAKRPAATIQLGFLSNGDEDQHLAREEYQEKLAEGIANGIDAYFKYIDEKGETPTEEVTTEEATTEETTTEELPEE
jgi:N-acetylmuramoyl-L-alanine amidase